MEFCQTQAIKKQSIFPLVKNGNKKNCNLFFGKTPKQSGVAGLQSLGIHLSHTCK